MYKREKQWANRNPLTAFADETTSKDTALLFL
jgi:hypothetical protein